MKNTDGNAAPDSRHQAKIIYAGNKLKQDLLARYL